MNNARVDAFREFATLLERFEQASRQIPVDNRDLAAALRRRDAEHVTTHSALLNNTGALIEQSQTGRVETTDHERRIQGALQDYAIEVTNSASTLARELDGPRGQLEDFGGTISNKLGDQWQELQQLAQADSRANESRTRNLTDFNTNLTEGGGIAKAIGEFLAQANSTLAAATQADELAESQQADLRALNSHQIAGHAFNQGAYLPALAILRETTRLAPGLAGIWLNLAHVCLANHDMDAAAVALEEADRLAPGTFDVVYAQGLYALHRDAADAAIVLLERSIQTAPAPLDEVDARLALADAYFRAEQPEAAVVQWRRVLEINPMDGTARTCLELLE